VQKFSKILLTNKLQEGYRQDGKAEIGPEKFESGQ